MILKHEHVLCISKQELFLWPPILCIIHNSGGFRGDLASFIISIPAYLTEEVVQVSSQNSNRALNQS
jgi:hypothetical protein